MPPDQNQNQQRVRNSAGVIFIWTAFHLSSNIIFLLTADLVRTCLHVLRILPLRNDTAHVRDEFIIRFIFHPL